MKNLVEASGAFSLLEKLHPMVPRETWTAFQKYVDLVFEWNAKMNLTGAQTPRDFIHQHLADCLGASLVLPKYSHWLDVGTGAGLPGLVWAMLDSSRHYFLLDSSLKRCAFLRRIKAELCLKHIQILSQRFESLKFKDLALAPQDSSLAIVSRGTSAPKDLLQLVVRSEWNWGAWYVFSNPKIHSEYLTLAPPLGVEVESVIYPRKGDSSMNSKGILTCLRKK